MKPEVSCYNTSSLLAYVRRSKGQQGIRQLLAGIQGIDEEYLHDTTRWISLEMLFLLFDNIQAIYGDHSPKLFYRLGQEVSATQEGALINIARWLGNTKSVITSSPRLNRRFNVDQEMEVISAGHDEALVINFFLPEYYDRERKDQCEWTKGIFAGIPMLWGLPAAQVREIACSFRLEDILVREYAFLNLDVELRDDSLLINGTQHARRVRLVESDCGKPLFESAREPPPGIARGTTSFLTGEYTGAESAQGSPAFLVTRTLIVDGHAVIREGEIYGAPYCLYHITWARLSFWRNLHNKTIGRYRLARSSKEELERLLVLSEQRLFETAQAKEELALANKALHARAQRLASQLVAEEKARRVFQVRAAQADAVARFLHQTSNLVLQPLASTMIVFEDLIEIADDCRTEWTETLGDDELLQELNEGLARVQETYPRASRVIDSYRGLFRAFYEVYASIEPERDVNQDLRYIETLVRNKYILTQVDLNLELDAGLPRLQLEGGMQSIFLELMHNAARYGAGKLLVTTCYDSEPGVVRVSFYNNGPPIPEEEWETVLSHGVGQEGRGFGLADARYIIETLNGGRLRLVPSDREGFSVQFVIELPARRTRGTEPG